MMFLRSREPPAAETLHNEGSFTQLLRARRCRLVSRVALGRAIHQLPARMGVTGSTLEALKRVREERVATLRREITSLDETIAEEVRSLAFAERQLGVVTREQAALASSPNGPVRVADLKLLEGRRARANERVDAARRELDGLGLRVDNLTVEIAALRDELMIAVGELKAVESSIERLANDRRAAVERSEEERAEELVATRSLA